MSALADLRQVLEEVKVGTNSISEAIDALDRAEEEQRALREAAGEGIVKYLEELIQKWQRTEQENRALVEALEEYRLALNLVANPACWSDTAFMRDWFTRLALPAIYGAQAALDRLEENQP